MIMKVPIFGKNDYISRQAVNNRLHYVGTNTPISDGGTGSQSVAEALYRLGGYTRIVGFSDNNGTSYAVLNLPSGGNNSIKSFGVYYGYSGIKRYIRVPSIFYGDYAYMPVALHYMTQGGNFVVRRGTLKISVGHVVEMLGGYSGYNKDYYSYYFNTDNEVWTKNEDLLIYKVVAFY